MKLKLITLCWDDDARAFDTTVLDAFCTEHDVLSVFEAIRQWRNNRARDEGKPPYVLFTNNQVIAITRKRPIN